MVRAAAAVKGTVQRREVLSGGGCSVVGGRRWASGWANVRDETALEEGGRAVGIRARTARPRATRNVGANGRGTLAPTLRKTGRARAGRRSAHLHAVGVKRGDCVRSSVLVTTAA